MRFSRSWLADLVALPDETDELCARLTAGGFNVEFVTREGDDVVLDLEITPNRPDCMNHVGLAREIAVLCGVERREATLEVVEEAGPVDDVVAVEVRDPSACPRYAARVVEGLSIGPSPDWLCRRLEAVGVRPINNVVDVTNYVLWEMGQPLHAFDLDRLAAARIVVRPAGAGERLVTLDEVERELVEEDLVIADAERAVALAGVMGGRETEVGGGTRRVLLESAHFDRTSVRLTAKRLGLHTDASHRFERGTDPAACVAALDRAAQLLRDLAGGRIRAGVVDVLDATCLARATVPLRPDRLDRFAGTTIDPDRMRTWLEGLGFEVTDEDDAVWSVRVPTWRRFDVERTEDLYEEVLRVLGFDQIPAALPTTSGSDGPETTVQRRRRRLSRHLVGQGFAEAIHYAFVSREEDATFPVLVPSRAPIALANPLSERYAVLRRSMAPALVDSARMNQRRGVTSVRLFEIGHVFGEEEVESVGIVSGGSSGLPWDHAREVDLFDLKGTIDSLLEVFQIDVTVLPADLPGMLAGTAAELVDAGGGRVGYFGQVDDDGGPFPLFVAEVLCDALGDGGGVSRVRVPSRFPSVAADLTLTHSLETSWAELAAAIAAAGAPELVEFKLKDRYRGEGVPPGAVNTTIAFLYNAPDRSLSQDEVNERQEVVRAALEGRFGADQET